MKSLLIALLLVSTASLAARNRDFIITDTVPIAEGNNSQIQFCGVVVNEQAKFYIPATLLNEALPTPAGIMCRWPTSSLALGSHSIRLTFSTGAPGGPLFAESPESMPTLNFILTDDAVLQLPAPKNLRGTKT